MFSPSDLLVCIRIWVHFEKGELTLWVEWLMQRVQPPVTIEQLLKELAHSTHVHRTQQTSKAHKPPKEQGGSSLRELDRKRRIR